MLSLDEAISKAVGHITRLMRHYRIEPPEWPMMKRESPELWAKIGELEWLGLQPLLPADEVFVPMCEIVESYKKFSGRLSSHHKVS